MRSFPALAVIAAGLFVASHQVRAQHLEEIQIPTAPEMPSAPMPAPALPSFSAPVEAAPVEAAPVEAAPSTEVALPGPPPGEIHEEPEDCDIHEMQCARSCLQLSPNSSYRACLRTECNEKSESCIEKMAKALESRDDDSDDDDDDDP